MLIDQADIVEKIKASGLSVLEISKKTGISSQRIYKFMSGRNNANYKDLVQLDNFFSQKTEDPQAIYNTQNPMDIQLKYISTLEEQNRMLKAQLDLLSANVEANLKLLGQGQAVILAHQKALEWYLTKQAAGNHGKKHQAELEELGKMLSMFAGPSPETGS